MKTNFVIPKIKKFGEKYYRKGLVFSKYQKIEAMKEAERLRKEGNAVRIQYFKELRKFVIYRRYHGKK